jgi:Skp family chaperone for outer membrane proteins
MSSSTSAASFCCYCNAPFEPFYCGQVCKPCLEATVISAKIHAELEKRDRELARLRAELESALKSLKERIAKYKPKEEESKTDKTDKAASSGP